MWSLIPRFMGETFGAYINVNKARVRKQTTPKNAEENKKTRKVSTEQTLDNNKGTLVALVALAALVALVA